MSRSPRSQIPKGGIRNPKYLHPAAPQPDRLAHPPNRDGIPNPIASPKPNRSHQNRARILSFPPSPSPPTNRTAGRIEPATLRAQPINQTRMTETGKTPERARVQKTNTNLLPWRAPRGSWFRSIRRPGRPRFPSRPSIAPSVGAGEEKRSPAERAALAADRTGKLILGPGWLRSVRVLGGVSARQTGAESSHVLTLPPRPGHVFLRFGQAALERTRFFLSRDRTRFGP